MLSRGYWRVRRVLRTWLSRLRRVVGEEPEVERVRLYVRGLTLDQWQRDPVLGVEAVRVAGTGWWREMMGVMYRMRPRGYPLRGESVTEAQALVELGRVQGFDDAIGVLEALPNRPAAGRAAEIEATWGVEEDGDELENKHER